MSNSTILQFPALLDRVLYASDNLTEFRSALGVPVNLTFSSLTGWLVTAFSPSGTTVTLYHTGGTGLLAIGGATFTNATARINGAGGAGLTKTNVLRCWARRKPGATGAITAQKILLKSWDGSALTEVGRIYVSAVAAGTAEPVSDVCEIIRNTEDPLITFPSAHPFNVVFETADTDLEVCIEAYGKAS